LPSRHEKFGQYLKCASGNIGQAALATVAFRVDMATRNLQLSDGIGAVKEQVPSPTPSRINNLAASAFVFFRLQL
jgi:hypothetical protein